MLLVSLITLAIASVSAFFSLSIREDVVKVAMGCVSLLSFLLTLLFAPWVLKLSIVAIPLIIDRFSNRATEKSMN